MLRSYVTASPWEIKNKIYSWRTKRVGFTGSCVGHHSEVEMSQSLRVGLPSPTEDLFISPSRPGLWGKSRYRAHCLSTDVTVAMATVRAREIHPWSSRGNSMMTPPTYEKHKQTTCTGFILHEIYKSTRPGFCLVLNWLICQYSKKYN